MEQVKQFELITLGLKILLGFIGTLTLGIGGVGLMNIMLVSVTQRTREIGMEKSLGAQQPCIFLCNSSRKPLPSALCGRTAGHHPCLCCLALGGTVDVVQRHGQARRGRRHPAGAGSGTLLVSTVILALVGLISGMLPAIRASRLNPIEVAETRIAAQEEN